MCRLDAVKNLGREGLKNVTSAEGMLIASKEDMDMSLVSQGFINPC